MTNDNERIDDLQRNGYRIIQNKDCFCFGMDAVLLSSFAKAQKNEQVLDLGTGNGVIPILMQAKNPDAAGFTGLEIQAVSADLARRSVELNGIGEAVKIVQGDIKEASTIFGGASFNVVTTNPPYMSESHGLTNPTGHKAIARHELKCTLDDVLKASAKLLKPGGHFFMVHRPSRLGEIMSKMTACRIEPKRMQLVYPYVDKEPNMVLIEGTRGGNPGMKIEKPLIVYKEVNVYTEQLLENY